MDCANLLLLNSGSEPDPDTSLSDSPRSFSKSSRHSPPSPSSPSPKRSRRSVEKRVVSIPIKQVEGSRAKGTSECAPPSDSWAWRKYGQKPIKGSPYPRGYYRCSSSKGCPARKQVERSRVDPTMLVVTYSCEHNHAWPLPKNHQKQQQQQQEQVAAAAAAAAAAKEEPDQDPLTRSPPESAVSSDPEESRFSDLIAMPDNDFAWFSEVGSTSSTSPVSDTLLYCPIFEDRDSSAEMAAPDEKIGEEEKVSDDVDDALFAGLGELPEYSVVFRRGYLERRMAAASW